MLLRVHQQCVLPARRLAWRRLRRPSSVVFPFTIQRSPPSLLVTTLTSRASSTSHGAAAASSSTHAAAASSSTSSPSLSSASAVESPKLAKRKLALHIGYIGTAYRGLQWQPPSQTAAAEAAAAKAAQEQGNPHPPTLIHLPPVENVLERALSLSGAITESNSGNPAKVGWTRSSRTDAGVHSLSTVVSLRAECIPEDFESSKDPEGVEFARGVNRHLPDDIRVFSAQRVNGGWCARGMCEAREYEYTLPARILLPPSGRKREERGGEKGDENQNDDDENELLLEAAVERLEEVLALYLGQRPFHNFTVRREYRAASGGGRKEPRESRRQRLGRREGGGSGADPAAAGVAASRSDDSEGEEMSEGAAAAATAAAAKQQQQPQRVSSSSSSSSRSPFSAGGPCGPKRRASSSSTSSTSSSQEEEGEGEGEESGGGRPLPFFVRPLWLEEVPSGDKVGPAHWRRVDSAEIVFPERRRRGSGREGSSAGGGGGGVGCDTTTAAASSSSSSSSAAAAPLVPGGEPALTVRISGGSFMLRQLRHMIGAAVAVARGSLPSPAVVAAALRVPARLSLPLAPPHTLVLTGARFGAYPAKALAPGDVAPWQGERLELFGKKKEKKEKASPEGGGSEGEGEGEGERAARAFRETKLNAALDRLLKLEDWDLWTEQLDRLRWDEAEMAEFVARAEADARAAEERALERRGRERERRAPGEEEKKEKDDDKRERPAERVQSV